ncbi:hypothetical protein FE633_13300 [Streptomyces montanus]|uniref:DUF8175 domain-containing protein n=1 Tax=Streptomyces montanus TaxID=2580423 RepID=A0A5R9FP75_9ACTN|nr:hypothetical protein [Streptomyces montanus]TLS45737.1 hypothetical protein FE633_13300 [Streptomyces montanus]
MSADPPSGESPSKSRLFIASGVFLALVVLLGGYAIYVGDGDTADKASSAPSTTPKAPAPPAESDDGSCPKLSDTDTSVSDNAPKGVTWELIDGFALPSSKTSGPGRVDGDVAHCYAHTPTGALIAAVQITGRQLSADDWESIVERQCVGDGKDYYLTKRRKVEQEEGSQALSADQHGQVAGYRFITYDDRTAVVDIVWRDKNGGLGAGSATMKWSGSDWKNEITKTPAAPGGAIDSLAGYTAWSGV